ncbi:hypothetical protein EHH44_12000 [Mycolicibacter terrae]|uniref:ESX-1 secretion-associated protein n=2 Tax=Mycolicibacter TaxID=1073531 RepID=A0A1A2NML4_MYCSD|nr:MULTISPECIES: type VII secretion target [Mycolicibacter]OBH16331.1 hypothetical protein A5694_06785 [Mycolicibacter sinensis]OBI26847.1 hypothetical protein A5710_00475 [Mycolicibacter sinensis]RRR44275.1 hypothetical protein EHH44_12000 [Mycolicibacter terrae]
MTSPTLKVTPEGLRSAAQRCEALAGAVAPALPTVTISGWQSTGAATSAVNAGMSTIGTACKSRMTANGGKLTKAAGEYQNQDDHAARRLTAVGSHPAAGSGGDGRAGGLPPGFTPLAPRGSGIDGGAAGGYGIGR